LLATDYRTEGREIQSVPDGRLGPRQNTRFLIQPYSMNLRAALASPGGRARSMVMRIDMLRYSSRRGAQTCIFDRRQICKPARPPTTIRLAASSGDVPRRAMKPFRDGGRRSSSAGNPRLLFIGARPMSRL